MKEFDLTGRTAWVTGAGKGLGRAMATALAAAGAQVAVTSRTEADLTALAAELGDDTVVLPGSVDEPGFAEECVERIGKLDVLVNCAGISPTFRRSEKVSEDDWHRVLRVNLDGTFFCARAAGNRMLAQGSGSIVNVSSVHATTGFDRIAAYAASKGGVEALTRVLAVEWADRGVRVNSLAPGYFATDLSHGLISSSWGEVVRRAIPQGRIGDASELAGAVVFLASDASSYVTGSTLFVDGGWTAQ
ncbi:short-chain dehydrogenase/reductase SDR [Amycolatopsis mediterranei S699]|uniref:Short-chain dehydrogenase/reductase SDR n=2 Tax=Amycolatopsis mediterranei TaxID=33910 RepID=A0A0H3DDS2_AMYMU|nr:glucose 1-dehydrogenase [Amycolatopsis mediterranei]ADJ48841.1 short-chain dehydrogenase/reductase SDR [Amycolatopsis mediterranei U32]AEK45787.1 short-chain dehydrogenase/reductase SDR [Amycolatopsis mediterranei S699]AFO80551.1 short-chain dehydrogenase/reductase SDR [Amycolatopsis mediterranei S699]AGT87679.1 short-chain dehydrogenase/reductase SDR [Amycolatopsis mediterranei RB]KDU94044.1 short-chain dehydrogenase [Amycolatopsis mediterranei]